MIGTQKKRKHRDNLTGFLFIAPSVVIISMFGIFPVFFSVYVSMHKWRIKKGRFLGIDNFEAAFGNLAYVGLLALVIVAIFFGVKLLSQRAAGTPRLPSRVSKALGILLICGGLLGAIYSLPAIWENGDDDMLDALRVTIWYSLGTVPVQLALGLFIAVLLDQNFRGKQAFRVIYLLPYIVPSVASATVFERLFSLRPESFANQIFRIFRAEPLQWLLEVRGIFDLLFGWGIAREGTGVVSAYWTTWAAGPSLALVSIMLYNYWVYSGYYALIYSNGLANIPRQLYEAAEVDGAKKSTVFFKIILPLLSPSTFFLSMLGIIGTFKAFNHIYVLRNAVTRGAADPMSVYIFFTFFRKSRFGYASALALLLFIIVMGLTLVQRKIMAKRVFYGE